LGIIDKGNPLAQTAAFFKGKDMDKFILSATLINAVLQYLDTRPHGEVRRLIDAITQDVQQQQPPAETTVAE
jgi:hypothetical protein